MNNIHQDNKDLIRVKLLARVANRTWLRQMPDNSNIWGNCEFIFDPEETNYDWLVVYDDLPPNQNERFSLRNEILQCPQQNTMLITTEPSSIKVYGSFYTAQFGHVLTSQEPWALKHPRRIYSQPALHWFYGLGQNHVVSYDQMIRAQLPVKDKIISTVCSNKKQRHTMHNKRYYFTNKLKGLIPDLDIYGHGVRDMDDKAEALESYRYHIAIENHIGLHHWTEKLSDAFLGFTLPFYCGCPNAADYFPSESFINIDINDLEGSRKIIVDAINNDEFTKRLPFIKEARRRVLDEYNIFAVISTEINKLHKPVIKPGKPFTLRSRRALRKKYPHVAITDLANKIKNRIRTTLN